MNCVLLSISALCFVTNIHSTAFGGSICPVLEEFSLCSCKKTCTNPSGHCSSCSAGCYCKQGLVRNSDGQCVPEASYCKETKLSCESLLECLLQFSTRPPCYDKLTTAQPCYHSTNTTVSSTESISRHETKSILSPYNIQSSTTPLYPKPTKDPRSSTTTERPAMLRCGSTKPPQHLPETTEDQSYPTTGNEVTPTSVTPDDSDVQDGTFTQREETTSSLMESTFPGLSCSNLFEVFQEKPCEKTCEDLNGTRCSATNHIRGCVCTNGFVRFSGYCVPSGICWFIRQHTANVPTCSNPLEEYQERRCERTCQDIHGKKCDPAILVPGCVCREGFVRALYGECVPSSVCDGISSEPVECSKPGEIYGNYCCERTCEDKTGSNCNRQVCENKCICQHGFIRDTSGSCTRAETCDIRSSSIVHSFHHVKTSTTTSLHKQIWHNRTIIKCNDNGCTKQFFSSNQTDFKSSLSSLFEINRSEIFNHHKKPENEIEEKDAPLSSDLTCDGENEEFSSCGCDGECGRRILCRGCIAGCYCKKGFFRNSVRNCVPIIQC